MKRVFLVIFLFVFLCPFVLRAAVDADKEEELEDGMVIKTVDGLRFTVPKDRPIEKKDGIIGPMALDRYVAIKFSKIEERLQKIEASIDKIEERLTSAEEEIKVFKKSKKFLEYFYQD